MELYSKFLMPEEREVKLKSEKHYLGEHNSGYFEKVSLLEDSEDCNLKTVNSKIVDGSCDIDDFTRNEILLFSNLEHSNIVKFKSYWTDKVDGETCNVRILTELCDYDMLSLARDWTNQAELTNDGADIIYRTATGVLNALVYMHSRNKYHSNIKPENIMFKKGSLEGNKHTYKIKLSGFLCGSNTATRSINGCSSPGFLPYDAFLAYLEQRSLVRLYDWLFNRRNRGKLETFLTKYKNLLNLIENPLVKYAIDKSRNPYNAETLGRKMRFRINQLNAMKWSSELLDLYALGKSLIEIIAIMENKNFRFTGRESEKDIINILDSLNYNENYKLQIKEMIIMDKSLSAAGQLKDWEYIKERDFPSEGKREIGHSYGSN